jgi:hypothetical protein
LFILEGMEGEIYEDFCKRIYEEHQNYHGGSSIILAQWHPETMAPIDEVPEGCSSGVAALENLNKKLDEIEELLRFLKWL